MPQAVWITVLHGFDRNEPNSSYTMFTMVVLAALEREKNSQRTSIKPPSDAKAGIFAYFAWSLKDNPSVDGQIRQTMSLNCTTELQIILVEKGDSLNVDRASKLLLGHPRHLMMIHDEVLSLEFWS